MFQSCYLANEFRRFEGACDDFCWLLRIVWVYCCFFQCIYTKIRNDFMLYKFLRFNTFLMLKSSLDCPWRADTKFQLPKISTLVCRKRNAPAQVIYSEHYLGQSEPMVPFQIASGDRLKTIATKKTRDCISFGFFPSPSSFFSGLVLSIRNLSDICYIPRERRLLSLRILDFSNHRSMIYFSETFSETAVF